MRKSHYNIKSLCIKRLQPDLKCIKFLDATKFKRLWIILFSHFFLSGNKNSLFFPHSFFFPEVKFPGLFFDVVVVIVLWLCYKSEEFVHAYERTERTEKKQTTCRRVQAWESVVCNSVCSLQQSFFLLLYFL